MSHVLRSRLEPQITAYVTLKQALGRRFTTEIATLAHLDRFLVERRRSTLTASSFAAWSLTLSHLTPTVRRNRMRIVRNFCLYLRRTHRGVIPALSQLAEFVAAPAYDAPVRENGACMVAPRSQRHDIRPGHQRQRRRPRGRHRSRGGPD